MSCKTNHKAITFFDINRDYDYRLKIDGRGDESICANTQREQ